MGKFNDGFKRRIEVTIEIDNEKREAHTFFNPEEGLFDKIRAAYNSAPLYKQKKASILIQQLILHSESCYSIEKTINMNL